MAIALKRRKPRPVQLDRPFERLRSNLLYDSRVEILSDKVQADGFHYIVFLFDGALFIVSPDGATVQLGLVAVKQNERGAGKFDRTFRAFLTLIDLLKIDLT